MQGVQLIAWNWQEHFKNSVNGSIICLIASPDQVVVQQKTVVRLPVARPAILRELICCCSNGDNFVLGCFSLLFNASAKETVSDEERPAHAALYVLDIDICLMSCDSTHSTKKRSICLGKVSNISSLTMVH